MAKKQRERHGLVDIVGVGNDREDLLPLSIAGSRFSYVKEMYSRCPGKLMKTNLLIILFILPAVAWLIYRTMLDDSINYLLPYSANLGIGYPVISDIAKLSASYKYYYNILKYTVLVLFFIVAAFGIAGGVYTVRQIMQDEKVKIFKTFFRGIKKQAMPCLWFGFILGLENLVLMFAVHCLDYISTLSDGATLAIKIVVIVIMAIMLILTIPVALFYITQNVCFEMKSRTLLKNSFIYTFRLPLQNIAMFVITMGPVALIIYLMNLYLTSMSQNNFFAILLSTFGVIIFALYLASFVLLAWSVYGDFLYENSIVPARERLAKNQKKGKK